MLLLEAVEPSGSLVAADARCDAGADSQLLLATGTQVSCFAAAPAAAASASESTAPGLPLLWQQRIAWGRVQHAAILDAQAGAYLLVTSHGAASPPRASVVTVWPGEEAGACPVVSRAAHAELRSHEAGEEQAVRAPPVFSNLLRCGGSALNSAKGGSGGQAFLLAASLHAGCVHLVHVWQGAGGGWQVAASASNLVDQLSAEPGSALIADSLALGPASARLGSSVLTGGPLRTQAAILYSSHQLGGALRLKHVACMEAGPVPAGTATAGDGSGGASAAAEDSDSGEAGSSLELRTCAWFHRNVHPTTSLVAALPGARMLVGAADGLALVQADAPQDRQLVRARLKGHPTCAAALSDRLAVVADSSGHLTLLDLQLLEARPVGGRLAAAPACLAFLPAAQRAGTAGPGSNAPAAEVPKGQLFVGSFSGTSQLVGLPRWRRLPLAGEAGQLAASVAPVSSASLFVDECGDGRLLACCGQAPFARLALGRKAAALSPLAVGGGDLPGLVRLQGLKASAGAPCHRYLLLSSDAPTAELGGSGWTLVLEAEGGELRSAALPGLQLEAPTLLARPLPGGNVLQVTPEGAVVFRPAASGAVQSTWRPPCGSPVSMVAQQGQYVALAVGSQVQVLHCGASGRLQEETLVELPQQASALAMFLLGSGSGAGGDAGGEDGEVWLAVGLWVSNEVLLQPLSASQPACRLSLECQPRSLAVVRADGGGISSSAEGRKVGSKDSSSNGSSNCGGSNSFLVVGSSSGEVLWWPLAVLRDEFGASSSVQLGECRWARAGAAPVSLHPVPAAASRSANASSSSSSARGSTTARGGAAEGGGCACLLAVSDQALLLGPDPVCPSRLVPARLHGAQGITAACPLLTAELPGSSVAYVQGGELHIGSVDASVRLRWDELALPGGTTASSAVYLPSCGAAAVACSEPGGSSLRLVHTSTLQQLASLAMPAGHAITALAAAELPCSSLWELSPSGPEAEGQASEDTAQQAADGPASSASAAAAAATPPPQPGSKQFLLVGLSPEGYASAAPAASSGSGSGAAAMIAADEPPSAAQTGDGSQPWWRQEQPDAQDGPEPGSSRAGQPGGALGDDLFSPPRQPVGLLRVYEVRRRRQHNSEDSSSGAPLSSSNIGGAVGGGSAAHELVLWGTCALPAAVCSLAVVQPDLQIFDPAAPTAGYQEAAAQAAQAAAEAPLLAAGCHDGHVRLYRVFVDDAGVESRHAVEQGLAAIAADVGPLSLAGPPQQAAAGQQEVQAEAIGGSSQGPAPAAVAGRAKGLWHGQVALQLVAKGSTRFGGVPVSLGAAGSCLYALDFLSSITAFSVQPLAPGRPPSLLPLSAGEQWHISAMLPLAEREVLACLHSGSLLLLRRDTAQERAHQLAAKQRWQQAREGGDGEAGLPLFRRARAGGAAGYVPAAEDSAQLEVANTSGLLGSSAAAICPGLLGVPLRTPAQLHSSGGNGAPATGSTVGQAAAATVVGTGGSVLSARLLDPEAHRALWQLHKDAQLTAVASEQAGWQEPLRVGGGSGEDSAGPATCIDSGMLAAAFLHPAWRQRLLKDAPAWAVEQGRAALEAHGLL